MKKVLRKSQVLEIVGLKLTKLDELVKNGKFPQPIKIADSRAVGWIDTEVQAWIDGKIAERDAAFVGGAE